MSQSWYTDDGTRVEGPFSGRDLQARAADGRLLPTHRVSPNRKQWREAERIKGLRFPVPTVVVPPPFDPPQTVAQPPTVVFDREASTEPDEALPDPVVLRPATPKPGDEVVAYIPGYQVTGVLGAGGCGVVYEATQANLGRVVALKTVQVSARLSASATGRFAKEAVSLGRLQHPNIVSVFDCGRHADQVYFAMELLRGQDLGQRIAQSGPLDERTAWAVARQTAAALAHAATEGVYHRDVKPANLFLVKMPTGFGLPPDLPMVKVTDFGLALTRRNDDTSSDVRLTAAGVVLGTPTYMAPEQFKSPDVDHLADIYALGATVYHALTGELPFPGTTVWDVMMRKAEGGVPRPGPPVSDESADLVQAMMAVDRADRPQSYDDLIARIDALPAMAGMFGTSSGSIESPFPRVRVSSGSIEAPASRVRVSSGSIGGPQPRVPSGLLPTEIFDAPLPPVAVPRKRRLAKVALVTAAVAGLIGVGVVGAVAVGNGFGGAGGGPKRAAIAYKTLGLRGADLYNGQDITGWVPMGGPVTTTDDKEGGKVLEIGRAAKREFSRPANYRLTIGFDLHEAAEADITACVPAGADLSQADDAAPRLVLRVSRKAGAVLGNLTPATGEFAPVGPAVPFPPAAEMEGRSPYLAVQIERTGDVWSATFHKTKVGAAPDDGRPKLPELRVKADAPVRIDGVSLEELVPVQ